MKKFDRVFLTGAVLGALSVASFAHAASFVVTRFDDPAPGTCDSDCSLREAVIAANAAGGTNDIQLGTGTYNLTIAENGGETGGSLDIENSLTIQGQGADATIINGVQPGLNSRIIQAFDSNLTIVLDGLTVQNGDSSGGAGGGILTASTSQTLTLSNCRVTNNIGGNGGGLFSNAQTLIRNCRFDHNEVESDTDGGGVHFGSSAGLVVENSTFDNNELPEDGRGAGLFFEGGASLSISGSRFEANKLTLNGSGAGLNCAGSDPVTITNTVFTANSIEGGSGAGAGIACSPDSILLDGVTISNNTTDGGEYAAMLVSGGGAATIRNSRIEGNRITAGTGRFPAGLFTTSSVSIENSSIRDNVNEGSGDGGGMWIAASLTVTGSTFSGNRTNGNAGALQLTAAAVNISNSTFSGNEAQSDGGAIHIDTGNGTFNNVTISGNTATGLGGGVFFDNFVTFTIRNSILSGNESDSSPDCSAGNALTSGGYNLIGSDTGCLIDPPEGDAGSTDIYGVDPLLGALADNGGPTETLALLTNSPAIDAGDPAGCADQNGDPLTTDQRGAPRPFGARCDIGAFEFGSAPPGTSNLSITKSVDDADVFLQAVVTFTLIVENQGPADNTTVVAADTLPAGFALVSATGAGADCVTLGNGVTCTAATLAAGASFTVTVVATAEEAGDWVNTAQVSGDAEEFDPADNTASVTVTIEGGDLGPIISGGGCILGAAAPASPLSLGWLAVLAGILIVRRRG